MNTHLTNQTPPITALFYVDDWRIHFAENFLGAWNDLMRLLEHEALLENWLKILFSLQSRLELPESHQRVPLTEFLRELSWIIDNRDPNQCGVAPEGAESMARLCLHPEALRKASAIRLGDPYTVEEVRKLIDAETPLVVSWLETKVASGAVENWLGRSLEGGWVAGWRAFPEEEGVQHAPIELAFNSDPIAAEAELATRWLLDPRQIAVVPVDPATPTARKILAQLQAPETTADQRRTLVWNLESLPIPAADRETLFRVLSRFIANHRDSSQPEDQNAAGAAVRKLVLNTPTENSDRLAVLLEAAPGKPVPLPVALEVAKAVLWQQSAHPAMEANSSPNLAAKLLELVETYTHDERLAEDNSGATALNAILALLVMRGHLPAVQNCLRRVSLKWFTQQVGNRAQRLQTELVHDGGEMIVPLENELQADLRAIVQEFAKTA